MSGERVKAADVDMGRAMAVEEIAVEAGPGHAVAEANRW